jgi:hypothetical protein
MNPQFGIAGPEIFRSVSSVRTLCPLCLKSDSTVAACRYCKPLFKHRGHRVRTEERFRPYFA